MESHLGPNGAGRGRKSFFDRFETDLFPQAANIVADAESVLRNELRLFEARISREITKLRVEAISVLAGVLVLFASFVLFVVALFFALTENFPNLPTWGAAAILSAGALIAGLALLRAFSTGEE